MPANRTVARFMRSDRGGEFLTPPGRLWRYFTVLSRKVRQHDDEEVCVAFKNAVLETWVAAACSRDGGITFSPPSLVLPSTWPSARMTHNLAMVWHPEGGGSWVAVGGQYRPRVERGAGDDSAVGDEGIFLTSTNGSSWCYSQLCRPPWLPLPPATPSKVPDGSLPDGSSPPRAPSSSWRPAIKLLDGTHASCVEKVHASVNPSVDQAWLGPTPPGAGERCEFDGRLSLVRYRGRWLLYTRANVARGVRQVQYTVRATRWFASIGAQAHGSVACVRLGTSPAPMP